jgi:hypothetical protein
MKLLRRFLIGALLVSLHAGFTYAAMDEQQCAALIQTYGRGPLARILLSLRNGRMTVDRNGKLQETMGLPDSAYISQRSVCRDIELTGLAASAVIERLDTEKKKNEQIAARFVQEQQNAQAERQRFATLETGPESEACHDHGTAYAMSQKFIKQGLKSPYSAVFAPATEAEMSYRSGCHYEIRSYVDSQNGFGAMLRVQYHVIVQYIGGGNWKLKEARFFK